MQIWYGPSACMHAVHICSLSCQGNVSDLSGQVQVVLIMGLLFAKTVYQELEVDTEMQHGLLPGCVALAAKFVPTMKQVCSQALLQLSVCCCSDVAFCSCLVSRHNETV